MYTGKIINDGPIKDVERIVEHDGKFINPSYSLRVVNHSPTGFCWGYGGSGPAQLALAILLEHFKGDQVRAKELYQDFKFKVIARLPMDEDFQLTDEQVESAISQIDIERMKTA
jgi:hypothetical protein